MSEDKGADVYFSPSEKHSILNDSPFCFRRIVVTAHAHEGSEQQWAFRYGSELSRKSPKGFFLFDDKGSDIGIGCRHGHSAEDTVAFAPCDDPDVVAGILFELGTPVLGDGGTGCVGFNGSGLVPVPGSIGIRCEENVVSIAAVDDIPADVHLQVGS